MPQAQRILIVDDELHIRTLYEEELGDEGYEVFATQDTNAALGRIQDHKTDLVILDIRMPEMDGRDFLAKARDLDMEIPIIISSAYASFKQDFGVWGADAYLVKTHDLTELKGKIRELLAMKKETARPGGQSPSPSAPQG